jgi:perosamine synthetase
VSSGTAALEVALYAAGLEAGDEIILPSFTIISCAIACIRRGLKPVLVDIDPLTWTMDVNQIEGRITGRTRAIMPVHVYGHPVDMDPVFRIAAKHGLKIVEDMAEVQGAEYFSAHKNSAWLKCGNMSDVAATSFYANKIITTGEGGMVLTNDEATAERARSYRNLCFDRERRFIHTDIGYNFRMTNLQAAVGLAQSEQFNSFVGIKRRIGEYYRGRLSGIEGLRFMHEADWARSVYWMYCIELEPGRGITADAMMDRLGKRGIGTRPFFRGLHNQPSLHNSGLFQGESFPKTDHASKWGLYLPSGMNLTETSVDEITGILVQELRN